MAGLFPGVVQVQDQVQAQAQARVRVQVQVHSVRPEALPEWGSLWEKIMF